MIGLTRRLVASCNVCNPSAAPWDYSIRHWSSDLHRELLQSPPTVLRQLERSFTDAGLLLIVFLKRSLSRGDTADPCAGSGPCIAVSTELALSALLDVEEEWVCRVRQAATVRGFELSFAQLHAACTKARSFEDLAQFAGSVRSEHESASLEFRRQLDAFHAFAAEETFDVVALFLATYLPGLGISVFSALANWILAALPCPSKAGEDTKPGWPHWTPRDLRRLLSKNAIELKTGSDGSRSISSPLANVIRGEFEQEHVSLAELRRALLAVPVLPDGFPSTTQIACWTRIVYAVQRDDPATEPVRRLARLLAATPHSQGWQKNTGTRAAAAMAALWGAREGEAAGEAQTAAFVEELTSADAELALQALRFCSRDSACPVPPARLLSWISRALRAGGPRRTSLVYAFVRDITAISDEGRRETFLRRIVEWILDERVDFRGVLRDCLASAMWSAVVSSGTPQAVALSPAELPCIGGLSEELCEKLVICLSEETKVRIIDPGLQRAFGDSPEDFDGHAVQLDRLECGLVLCTLLAEWRRKLAGDAVSPPEQAEAWLRRLIHVVSKDRSRRKSVQRAASLAVDVIRFLKIEGRNTVSRQRLGQLLADLLWTRAELRLSAASASAD